MSPEEIELIKWVLGGFATASTALGGQLLIPSGRAWFGARLEERKERLARAYAREQQELHAKQQDRDLAIKRDERFLDVMVKLERTLSQLAASSDHKDDRLDLIERNQDEIKNKIDILILALPASKRLVQS